MIRRRSAFVVVALLASLSFAGQRGLSKAEQAAVGEISEDSLKGNLWFISSDLLEGRNTPSKGLDLAATYIAAQFQKAGLEPAGDNGYFQMADYKRRGSDEIAKVQNVIGVLRGSDPKLRDTYILLTAHYDHLGMKTSGEGDLIFNGANDDGSGTVGVMEIASALSKLNPRPKRSIVFMTFYGEEKGLVGSRYYGAHPVFPVAKTIADINLEQIGRTDDDEGPRVSALSMTGYDYSDLGPIFKSACGKVGVDVQKHPRFSDAYFARSDNQAMADLGVPAHTVCTAFSYPDYHRVGDHWDKIDFPNLTKICKGVTVALLEIANSAKEPAWNAGNPKAAKYLEVWKASHK